MRALRAAALLTLALGLAPGVLAAGDFGLRGVGVRGGVTINPDQVHVGGHLDFGEIIPQLRFVPSLEVGFGDDVTVVALNGDVTWIFRNVRLNLPEDAGTWRPYLGGGLALIFEDRDLPPRSRADDTELDLGVNLLAGLSRSMKKGQELLFELRAGVIDAPDVKLTVGYTF